MVFVLLEGILMPKLTVVFFSMQPGATMESFDKERFINEAVLPIRDILAPPCFVGSIIIVTLSSVKYKFGEVFVRRLSSEDGPPPHLFSPTSDAVSKHLSGPIREGKVTYFNLEHLSEESAIDYMTDFAFAGGAQQVIVLRHGMRLPPRGMLRILHEKMLMDERRSIVCQTPEQHLTPA